MTLFNSPLQVANLTLPNRLVMPPMATAKSGDDGKVTRELCDYYEEKSRGGHIGLIIAEHSFVSPEGKAGNGQLSISDDGDIPGLKALVSVIHRNDTKVMAQINHAGGAAKREVTGCEAISAGAVLPPRAAAGSPLPREMTAADIRRVTDDFARAAGRAKEAGFDGVEIHSAHGYLLNQFFSPLTNRRTDSYGASSLHGRIRFHLEVIGAVRSVVGTAYPLALRLGACDYMEGGTTMEDSVAAALEFEKAGIDLLDISGAFCGYVRPGSKEQGYFSELTEAIKKSVSIPVILTGGIVDREAAERLLEQNKADLIGVGRAIIKDSSWAEKAMLAHD